MKECELKPCPFCGKIPELVEWWDGGNGYYAGCSNEGCQIVPSTNMGLSREEAIKAWNTRTVEE